MAVAIQGTATVGEVASGTSVTCNVPGGVVAGELLVAAVADSNTTGAPGAQTGWTALGTVAPSGASPTIAVYCRTATASEPASYTFTGLNAAGASRATAEMARLSGVDGTTRLDAAASTATGFATALVTPSVVTASAGALMLYAVAVQTATNGDITAATGTTLLADSTGTGRRAILASEARPTAGATGTRSWSQNSTSGALEMVGIALAFRPGATSGDTTAPSVPTGVTATANSATSVTVSWTASTDDVGVASYQVKRGGTAVASPTGTSYTDTTVSPSTTYSYTVNAVDAAGNRSADSAAASVTTPAGLGSFVFQITGTPTGTSCPVKVKTSAAASVRLKVGTNSALTAGTFFTSAATPDASQYSAHSITGLTAGTAYFYAAEVDGALASQVGSFTTDSPASQRNFRVAFGSCFTTANPTGTAFSNITANAPEVFIHLGDWHYDDDLTTSQAAHQASIENQITSSAPLRQLIRSVPLAYAWSDHDSGNNDWTGGPATWTPSYNLAYREVLPVEGTLPTGGIYRSFGRGRVKFILTDSRSYKSLASATDGAAKTMFGTTQEAWIASELADPNYPVKVICLDVPWVYPTTAGDDKWGGYTAAAQRLINAIQAANAHVLLIHGDSHSLCADDGSSANNRGGLPVAGAAPFGHTTSIKGGPYSAGTWPTSGAIGTEEFQHGLLDVTDTGTAITIRYSGRDTSNTERVSLTKSWTLTTPNLDKVRVGAATVGFRVGTATPAAVYVGTTKVWP